MYVRDVLLEISVNPYVISNGITLSEINQLFIEEGDLQNAITCALFWYVASTKDWFENHRNVSYCHECQMYDLK